MALLFGVKKGEEGKNFLMGISQAKSSDEKKELCRYWVADREGIEDTWITAFAPYIIKYGDDGSLDATMVRARISKPNLYMTSVYWALMTVSLCLLIIENSEFGKVVSCHAWKLASMSANTIIVVSCKKLSLLCLVRNLVYPLQSEMVISSKLFMREIAWPITNSGIRFIFFQPYISYLAIYNSKISRDFALNVTRII